MKSFLKNYRISVPLGLAVTGLLAWLAFGHFAVQTLFLDDKVSEAAPVFDSPAPVTTTPEVVSTTLPEPTDTASLPTPNAPAIVPATAPAAAPATAPAVTTPAILVEVAGTFRSRDHTTTGTATVLGNGTGQRFLRFESFSTSNGPDLNVYLVNSSAGGVSDFVDLGNLKGNIGDQNYDVPVGTDLAVYDTVLIWCVRFSAPFGDAALVAP